MRIEKTYPHSVEELRSRIDKLVDSLQSLQLPAGISISNISKRWEGDHMLFSFDAAKGFFGTTINGEIVVSGSSVVLDLAIPALVLNFVDEPALKKIIEELMDRLLK